MTRGRQARVKLPLSMALEDAMRTQRAIRRFKPDPVDDALLLHLLELATKAPSGGGRQYAEFIIVRDRDVKARLEETQQIATRMAGSFPSDAREFVEFLLHYRKELMDKNGAMLQAVLSEILVNPQLRQRYYQELVVPSIAIMQEHLQERIERGQIRAVDAGLAAHFLVGLTTGLYVLQVLGDPQISYYWDDLSETITGIIFDGLDNQA